MPIALLLTLLASSALGCAPLPGGGNGTTNGTVGTTGTFAMAVNPPVTWTTNTDDPSQGQQVGDPSGIVQGNIEQAVKLFLVDWKYPVDGITVKLDALPAELSTVNLLPDSCDATSGYVANVQGTVTTHCTGAAGAFTSFIVPITGTFTAGNLGVPITKEIWDALAISAQNKLMSSYNVGFGPGTTALKITPSTS